MPRPSVRRAPGSTSTSGLSGPSGPLWVEKSYCHRLAGSNYWHPLVAPVLIRHKFCDVVNNSTRYHCVHHIRPSEGRRQLFFSSFTNIRSASHCQSERQQKAVIMIVIAKKNPFFWSEKRALWILRTRCGCARPAQPFQFQNTR